MRLLGALAPMIVDALSGLISGRLEAPITVGVLDAPESALDVDLVGDLAFVANEFSGCAPWTVGPSSIPRWPSASSRSVRRSR